MKNPAVGAAGVFGITDNRVEGSNSSLFRICLNIGENFPTDKRSLLPER